MSMYEKRFNVAYGGGWISHYCDTLEEVQAISRKHGGIAFVSEGGADIRYHDDGVTEYVRQTYRSVPLAEAIGLGATRDQRREALLAVPGVGEKTAEKILDAIDEADTEADGDKHRALMYEDGDDGTFMGARGEGFRVVAPKLPASLLVEGDSQ